MAVKHIDAYKYSGKPIRFTNSNGTLELKEGSVFYYVTMDKPGDYISLDSKGPYWKLSPKSFDKVSERSDTYMMDVDVPSPKSPGENTTFDNPMQYNEYLRKKQAVILGTLQHIADRDAPSDVSWTNVKELTGAKVNGQLGVEFVDANKIKYRLMFNVTNSPFFSYSIWIPRKSKWIYKDIPKWAKALTTKIPEIQQTLFTKLKLKINDVTKRKSIVNLPMKPFDGTIYTWSTRI